MDIWQPVTIDKNQCLQVCLGSLALWVYNCGDEWHVGYEYPAGQMEPARFRQGKKKPDIKTWQRWTKEEAAVTIQLRPVMPDRAVVVKSEFALTIPGKSHTQFFIGIPIWLQVLGGEELDVLMFEKPIVQLSNTWFGEMETGELCYYLESGMAQSVDQKAPFSGKVICPVKVMNQSKEILELSSLRVDVKFLAIFSGKDCLWSNGLKVSQPEGRDYSHVEVKKSPPKVECTLKKIADPREVLKSGLLKSTFSGLMHVTNIWSG